jgi:hypothetical protein
MSLVVEALDTRNDFPESLRSQVPNIQSLTGALAVYGTQEDLVITSDSPGNSFLLDGVSPTEIPVDQSRSLHQFEQWLLKIDPNAPCDQMSFNI